MEEEKEVLGDYDLAFLYDLERDEVLEKSDENKKIYID